METRSATEDLANLINEAADTLMDVTREINELHERLPKLETLKAALSRDIQRAQAALDQIQAQEYAAEIDNDELEHTDDGPACVCADLNHDYKACVYDAGYTGCLCDIEAHRPARFEVGGVYTYRLATDASTLYEVKVVARTPKFVTIEEGPERQVQRKVNLTAEGVEYVMPHGRYSMAPLLSADSRIG